MKNLKKVLALVLACALVLGSGLAVAAKTYPDVKADASYAPAVSILSALKIIEGDDKGNFNPDKTITRAEFAKVLDVALGADGIAKTTTSFTDVASDHWASGYIAYATQLGIIKGYGDGKFGPEDPVTYEQAIKMIVVALGYEPVAADNGGYPTGYMMVAADKGITKGASGKIGDPALRSTVAVLLANGIDTPVMKRVSYGSEAEYATMDGAVGGYAFESLLNTKLNAYKIEATVIANAKTALTGAAIQKAGMVAIEIKDLLKIATDVIGTVGSKPANIAVGESGADALLNYHSVLYIRELANGDFEILSATPKQGKTVELNITAAQAYNPLKDTGVKATDATNLTTTNSKLIYAYWENSRDTDTRVKTIDIDSNFQVIFNGVAQTSLGTANLDAGTVDADLDGVADNEKDRLIRPSIGNIKFVDNDNDGDYDILDVKSYATAVVLDAVEATKRINFLGGSESLAATGANNKKLNSITLDTYKNADLKEWTITKDGAPIELKDIQPYDVVNYLTDNFETNGIPTFFEIIVTRNKVSGAITEVDGNEYYIDGKVYKLATGTEIDLELQDAGDFYLDMNGNIVYTLVKSTASDKYAYLYKFDSGTMDSWQIRFFDYEGKDKLADIASNLRINNVSKSSLDKTAAAYTRKEFNDMFGAIYTIPAGDDGTVGNVTVKIEDIATPNTAYPAGTVVTPKVLLHAIVGNAINTNTVAAPVLAPTFLNALSTNKDLVRFTTFSLNSDGKLIELGIALNDAGNDKIFNYAGTESAPVMYQSSLIRFKAGQSLTEKTKVFYIPKTNGEIEDISEFQVRGVTGLKDEAYYTPYYFSKDADGVNAVVIFEDSNRFDTSSPIAVFAKSTSGKDNDDVVSRLYFWKNGAAEATPLVADNEVKITGVRGSGTGYNSTAMPQTGDVFIYDLNSKGRVGKIHILFTPGNDHPVTGAGTAATFENLMEVSGAGDWMLVNDATASADSEIWFGYVYRKSLSGSGVTQITLVDAAGNYGEAEVFSIPNTAKVVVYNPSLSETQRLKAGSVGDINNSYFPRVGNATNGNIDFANGNYDQDEMEYAFIRVYNGAVTEVVVVDYAN